MKLRRWNGLKKVNCVIELGQVIGQYDAALQIQEQLVFQTSLTKSFNSTCY